MIRSVRHRGIQDFSWFVVLLLEWSELREVDQQRTGTSNLIVGTAGVWSDYLDVRHAASAKVTDYGITVPVPYSSTSSIRCLVPVFQAQAHLKLFEDRFLNWRAKGPGPIN